MRNISGEFSLSPNNDHAPFLLNPPVSVPPDQAIQSFFDRVYFHVYLCRRLSDIVQRIPSVMALHALVFDVNKCIFGNIEPCHGNLPAAQNIGGFYGSSLSKNRLVAPH